MSRSRMQSSFAGHTTAESEAAWKAQVAHGMRRSVHQTLGDTLDGDALPGKHYAIASPWDGPKAGKQRFDAAMLKWMRK